MRCTVGFFLLATTICGVFAQDRNATTGALSLPNPKVSISVHNVESKCILSMISS